MSPLSADPPVPRELLLRMLLGQLQESERAALEARLLDDLELFEAFQEAESELLDDLVRGDLDPEQAVRLEETFLRSAEGRAKLTLARALAEGEVHRFRFGLLRFPRGPKSWFAIAAALAVLALSGWLAFENRGLSRDLASLRRQLAAREEGARASKPLATYELPLALLSRRGEGDEIPTFDLPAGDGDLALELDLRGLPTYPSYRLTFVDQADEVVYAEGGLKPSSPRSLLLKAEIPRAALRPGLYELALDGATPIGGWELIVRRPLVLAHEKP